MSGGQDAWQIGRRLAPPRFLLFVGLLIAGFFTHHAVFAPPGWTESAALAFDLAAAVFLVSLLPLLKESGGDVIRRHADANDANRPLVLVVTALVMIVVTAAIASELPGARAGHLASIVKLVVTLLLIWLFTNCVYALHYAHDFYTSIPGEKGDCGGIEFPSTPEPAYSDFLYFALTLGMTFQTSDTDITSSRIRTVALFHS
ncbi:MAG: DUF1345 domain-containing protein, partial [Novosphingobium sp.]